MDALHSMRLLQIFRAGTRRVKRSASNEVASFGGTLFLYRPILLLIKFAIVLMLVMAFGL